MANPTVEKLKALGLHHGEKIVVGLAAAVCMILLVLALQRPTIALTPGEVKEAANAARQNIDRQQEEKEILEKLEADGLTNPNFVQLAEQKGTQAASVDAVALTHPFTYPDPGAGLIRDTIDLIAPTDLLAQAGRGGIHVFALDDNGNRIPEDPTKADPKKAAPRRPPMMAMGSGGYPGMMPGMGRPGSGRQEAEAKKAAELAEARKKRAVAGFDRNAVPKTEEAAPVEELPYKEVTRGYRWVALVGILDYKQLRDNYARALKIDVTSAYPNFVRLDLERQQRTGEADWSDWAPLDRAANQRVFDNLTEQDDDEWTPPEVRLAPLVDILPYLRAGYWTGVHHVQLVPQEKLTAPKEQLAGMGGYPGMGGSEFMQSMMDQMAMAGSMAMSSTEMRSESLMGSDMMGSMYGGSGGMPGMMGSVAEDTNFPKSEAPELMVRALDFTVEPDTSYRYRVRIVVRNPNQNRDDVAPGVDNTSEELFGPWSEETAEVRVPPDVTIYAVNKAPAVGQVPRDDVVEFQVARWNPEDGVTVVRSFTAAPGQLVGDPYTVPVPVELGDRPERKLIDFNSRQLVLDTRGGTRPIPVPGVGGAPFDVPAVAMVLRPDGGVVVRNEARDTSNDELIELKGTYDRAIREAGKRRQPVMPGYGSTGGYEGMPSMMPGSSGP